MCVYIYIYIYIYIHIHVHTHIVTGEELLRNPSDSPGKDRLVVPMLFKLY